jgi:hypothetical protein
MLVYTGDIHYYNRSQKDNLAVPEYIPHVYRDYQYIAQVDEKEKGKRERFGLFQKVLVSAALKEIQESLTSQYNELLVQGKVSDVTPVERIFDFIDSLVKEETADKIVDQVFSIMETRPDVNTVTIRGFFDLAGRTNIEVFPGAVAPEFKPPDPAIGHAVAQETIQIITEGPLESVLKSIQSRIVSSLLPLFLLISLDLLARLGTTIKREKEEKKAEKP